MAAIYGDFRVSAAVGPYTPPRRCLLSPSKVDYSEFLSGVGTVATPKRSHSILDGQDICCHYRRPIRAVGESNFTPKSFSQDVESLLLNTVNMSLLERLNLAWKIIFPSATTRRNSNAMIAKQRLKMILFSDRCAVSDEAKEKIVKSIVSTLSDFVEIESQDKVQLSVSTEPDVGTIYSVTVPVRRVKPEYLDEDEAGSITNIEYKDTGELSGAVDVKFDFYLPNEKLNDFSL